MKTHAFQHLSLVRTVLCLAATFVLLFSYGQAAEPKAQKPAPASVNKKPEKEKKVIITGSNIPQKTDRLGRIPTTHSPVVIIGQREIERMGSSTVAGVLSRQPSFR